MHWALILFASEVRRPVVVCWQQQALVDLDGERHSLKVSAKRGGLGTEPYTGHSGVSACPSRSSCFVRFRGEIWRRRRAGRLLRERALVLLHAAPALQGVGRADERAPSH